MSRMPPTADLENTRTKNDRLVPGLPAPTTTKSTETIGVIHNPFPVNQLRLADSTRGRRGARRHPVLNGRRKEFSLPPR